MADFPPAPTSDVLDLFFLGEDVYLSRCIEVSSKVHAYRDTFINTNQEDDATDIFAALELKIPLIAGPDQTVSMTSWRGLYIYIIKIDLSLTLAS